MIPNTALLGNARWQNGKTRTLSILDPFYNGVTFRVPKAELAAFGELPQRLSFAFFRLKERRYEALEVGQFTLIPEADPDSEALGASVFRMETEAPEFQREMRRLLRDYSDYIRIRGEAEETLTERMTGHSSGAPFSGSLHEWRCRRTAGAVEWLQPLEKTELALPLVTAAQQRLFLKAALEEYADFCLEEMTLKQHPIAKIPVTHVAIGGSCPLQYPEPDLLTALLERAESLGVKPIVRFAPMEQRWVSEYRRRFLALNTFAEGKKTALELELNDLGAALLLRQLGEAGEVNRSCFRVLAGPLLKKTVKDPRRSFLPADSGEELAASWAAEYETYLRESLGFAAFSYEVGGTISVSGQGNALYLPLYQTNTAGFCTLFAACKNGSRGTQQAVTACPSYCEEYGFFYPEGMDLIGLGNTLYGCSMQELKDSEALNRLLKSGISRLMLHL